MVCFTRAGVAAWDDGDTHLDVTSRERGMQQQISVITLGIADLVRSRRFYGEGFGWTPVFENEEIVFYQMNGLDARHLASLARGRLSARRAGRAPSRWPTTCNRGSRAAAPRPPRPIRRHGSCARPIRRPLAASAATLPILTGTPGRSPGIRPGRSALKVTSPSAPEGSYVPDCAFLPGEAGEVAR